MLIENLGLSLRRGVKAVNSSGRPFRTIRVNSLKEMNSKMLTVVMLKQPPCCIITYLVRLRGRTARCGVK